MSNYRDDVNDTAVAGDSVWAGLRSIAESTAKASSVILSALLVMTVDTALASDDVRDKVQLVLTESAAASGQVLGTAVMRSVVTERARASDAVKDATYLLLVDAAQASEAVLSRLSDRLTDSASASNELIGMRTAQSLAQGTARAWDAAPLLVRDLLQDDAHASDAQEGRLVARMLVQDAAIAGDDLPGVATQSPLLTDSAVAGDAAFGVLRARNVLTEFMVAHDELLSTGALVGQVWTAGTDEWAMSRWPVGLTGLAVIDGALYATSPGGVFALDGEDEAITAELRTGAIDMTGETLGHPHALYMEYELAGTGAAASLAVTTTQSGAATTYAYPVALRPVAGDLTNARALLGRGLRGRHFAYALTLTGTRAYINDWGVLLAPSKRSI